MVVLLDKLIILGLPVLGFTPWSRGAWHAANILRCTVVPLFLVFWWGFAINHYLKIRHGMSISSAMFIMAVLIFALSMVVATIIDDV